MLHYILEIVRIEPYVITCKFNTNEVRKIDVKKMVSKLPIFYSKLLNTEEFYKVSLDDYGTLVWENGLDFCPDVLYDNSQIELS
jgi:hypothetical protein